MIVITGATGDIGSKLLDTIVNKDDVIIISRAKNNYCKTWAVDIENEIPKNISKSQIDTVIHMAFKEGFNKNNESLNMTKNMIEFSNMNKVKHFIFLSLDTMH